MTEDQELKIAAALEKVYRHYHESAGPASKDSRTRDFVFHMMDWYADLMNMAGLYSEPESHTQKEWDARVFEFLAHAVGHLMPAAKLAGVLNDPLRVTGKTKPAGRKPRPRLTAAR